MLDCTLYWKVSCCSSLTSCQCYPQELATVQSLVGSLQSIVQEQSQQIHTLRGESVTRLLLWWAGPDESPDCR